LINQKFSCAASSFLIICYSVVIPPFTIRLDINLSSSLSELAFNGTPEQYGVVEFYDLAEQTLDTAALPQPPKLVSQSSIYTVFWIANNLL
jgi:hypothetical protein